MTHPRLMIPPGMPPNSTSMQVILPVADLLREPDGALDCQLLFGAGFNVHQKQGDWVFGQAQAGNYTGYMRAASLAPTSDQTHRVSALSSHRYSEPALKSKTIGPLPFGALVSIIGNCDGFSELTDDTFVPDQHIKPILQYSDDFVAVFERFLGVPYLWGGDSIWGMDCSAAVQLSLRSCGIDCLRDTDMQETTLGEPLLDTNSLQRGDFIFWNGHVGVMRDETVLLHANAHHMAVASEPLNSAISRIQKNGDGPVTSRRRLKRG